jgi:hypothetical protein
MKPKPGESKITGKPSGISPRIASHVTGVLIRAKYSLKINLYSGFFPAVSADKIESIRSI